VFQGRKAGVESDQSSEEEEDLESELHDEETGKSMDNDGEN